MANTQERKGPPNRHGSSVSSFLASADHFVEKISAQAAAAAPEGNQRLVLQATGETLAAQTKKLTDYVRKVSTNLTPVQQRELDQFMAIQDGEAMVTRAVETFGKVLASTEGPTMGIFSWLQENIMTIKKIIEAILTLIFGSLPSWVQALINIIDEIINLILSLLGEVFGLRSIQVADELSRREVNFLKEMTALAAWRAASNPQPAEEEG